jgi:hypothetical protein
VCVPAQGSSQAASIRYVQAYAQPIAITTYLQRRWRAPPAAAAAALPQPSVPRRQARALRALLLALPQVRRAGPRPLQLRHPGDLRGWMDGQTDVGQSAHSITFCKQGVRVLLTAHCRSTT